MKRNLRELKKIHGTASIASTAYHEAAHAVIQYLADNEFHISERIIAVCVFTKGSGIMMANRVKPHYFLYQQGLSDKERDRQLYHYIAVCYAGYYAEFKYRGVRLPYNVHIGDDYNKIKEEVDRANSFYGKEKYWSLSFYLWQKDLRKVVSNRRVWRTIEELAQLLVSKRYVLTEELYELLDRHLLGKKFEDFI